MVWEAEGCCRSAAARPAPPSGTAGPPAGSTAPSPAVSPRFNLSRRIHLPLLTFFGGKVVFLLLSPLGSNAALSWGSLGAEQFHQVPGDN